MSNSNLVHNARTLLLQGTTNIDSEEFKWVGESKLVSDKFECTYYFYLGVKQQEQHQFFKLNF